MPVTLTIDVERETDGRLVALTFTRTAS